MSSTDSDRSASAPLAPGEINFLGERFHSSVALTYLGLGAIVGGNIAGSSSGGKVWAAALGLGGFFGGLVWILWRWRGRGRGA